MTLTDVESGNLAAENDDVRDCYEILHAAFAGGVEDFSAGRYRDDRNDREAYVSAQNRNAQYLLDQLRCHVGNRILDVGCGYGRLLQAARRRRVAAVGATISPQQIAQCRRRGFAVYELDYRLLPSDWLGTFDGVVLNGSIEHFVQVDDAAQGKSDQIYENMFEPRLFTI